LPLFSSSSDWLRWFRRRHAQNELESWLREQPLPPVTFRAVTNVELPPRNDEVISGFFYRVVRKGQAKWALFLCPCGCADVITLSLQRVHEPRWVVKPSNARELMAVADVDGALVGGASLKADDFWAIAQAAG